MMIISSSQLQCCGVEGPRDWDRNAYFNCSSGAVGSREACGVPFSCCRSKPQDIIRNKQCGYDVRKPTYVSGVFDSIKSLIGFVAEYRRLFSCRRKG